MNKEEKKEAVSQLDKDGYFKPSISNFIEEHASSTEFELVDDRPISDEEFLSQFDIDHLSPKLQNDAKKMFLEHKAAFALHKYDIGKTDLIEMNIQLKNNDPKMQKYHPIPFGAQEKVKEILDQLMTYGIIRKCEEPSQYCSNILVIKKKDGKNIRLLFDGRLLNYDTKRLPMATITKPEIMSHLVKKKFISSLDFADAFYHIPLDSESQPLTAFYSQIHGQRMCFNRAPQGLRNSPLYLKLLLDKIFADMSDEVLFYADDLLIATSGSIEHHFHVMYKVLHRLVLTCLKLRPEKLALAKDHIEFLGMVFKQGKLLIPEAKLEGFKKLPSPSTPSKAKSVICALSYYRNFCPNFAELSREILQLGLLHPKQFVWTELLEHKFRLLIETIIENCALYLPDPNLPYYVQTDASQYCAGGRVYQMSDEKEEKLISAISRTFTKTEQGYSIFKKEILALLYTLKAMDYFLRFAQKLIILVDAKSIVYLRLAKEDKGILLRFSIELSQYKAEIHHIPGVENVVSDVLSRHHTLSDIDNEDTLSEEDSIALVKKLTLPYGYVFKPEEFKHLLEGSSPPSIRLKPKRRGNKTVEGERHIKNTPQTLHNKKVNLPKTTNFRPGMLLPKLCVNVLKWANNVITRARAKIDQQISDSNEERRQSDSTVSEENESAVKKKKLAVKKKKKELELLSKEVEKQLKSPKKILEDLKEDLMDQTTPPVDKDPSLQLLDNITQIEPDIVDKTETGTEYFSYNDIALNSNLLTKGVLTLAEFKEAQSLDTYCQDIIQNLSDKNGFLLKEGILFFQTVEDIKPVLPANLMDAVIHLNHFTVYGNHMSKTRIERNIMKQFFFNRSIFKEKLNRLKYCTLCQIFSNKVEQQNVGALPTPSYPRESYSMDLITDLPLSRNGNKLLLIVVDDFSSYVCSIPIPDSSSKTIINALKYGCFGPLGTPHVLRCDEQASFYNSHEFYLFLQRKKIRLQPTAVAAPFSNARAESQIKNIKHMARKFLFQENCIEDWDNEIERLTESHNKSIGTYQYSPEEIMFGFASPSRIDILSRIPGTGSNPEKYMEDFILQKADKIRRDFRSRMEKKHMINRTFKNVHRILKDFRVGMLVLHKNLQVSTGVSSKWKPLFRGPYVIIKVYRGNRTADIQELDSNKVIKAHFNNLQLYYFIPSSIRPNQEVFDKFTEIIKNKYTLNKYADARSRYPKGRNDANKKRAGRKNTSAVLKSLACS
jgi:hypothetical protein